MSDWKMGLDNMFKEKVAKAKDDDERIAKNQKAAEAFTASVVVPAFEELKVELEKHGREVRISPGSTGATLLVTYQGNTELEYRLHVKVYPTRAVPVPETQYYSDGKLWRGEGYLKSGAQDYSIADITKSDIINHFLMDYKLHVHGKLA